MKKMIKLAKNISEYKQIRDEMIQQWVDCFFAYGSVNWDFESYSYIKITDKIGNNMIVSLDHIYNYFVFVCMFGNDI